MTQDSLALVIAALVPLLIVVTIDVLFLIAGHLGYRPELNGGKTMRENVSRAVGVSTIIGSLLILELWRAGGFGGSVPAGWLWIDAIAITAACGIAVVILWRWKGDPRQVENNLTDPDIAQSLIRAAQEAAIRDS